MTAMIREFGVLGVFMLMVPESACIPVPSEVTLLFSGFAVSRGWMDFPEAVLAATAGNLVGSLLAYGVGASGLIAHVPGGRVALDRFGRMIDEQGLRAVFVARLLPLARTFVSLPAGDRRLPLERFIALTIAGCALWATAFVLAGALAGSAWNQVSGIAGKVTLGVVLVLLLAAAKRALAARSGS
jgi:membrane protein DedA with SNARE-associated domain